jgi:hypothetical protein
MAVRAPGRDDHAVGDRTLVLQVDEDDVLGLLVVQAGQDEAFEGSDALVVLGAFAKRRGLLDGGLLRIERDVAVQGWLPALVRN